MNVGLQKMWKSLKESLRKESGTVANKVLLLMCGPAGAGKTTWVKRTMMTKVNAFPVYHISRDEIRFSMVSEDEEYFAREDSVFKEFIRQIQEHLDSDESCYIIADATHLTERARNKTLDALDFPKGIKIIPVMINPGIDKCLERNEQREGRARVPRSALRRMYFSFEEPTMQEKYKYDSILTGVQEVVE